MTRGRAVWAPLVFREVTTLATNAYVRLGKLENYVKKVKQRRPMLAHCCASVEDAGATLNQHCISISFPTSSPCQLSEVSYILLN